MKSKLAVATAALLSLALAGAALAGPGGDRGPRGHHGPPGPMMHIVHAVDLTADQQALLDDMREEGRTLHEEARASHEATREAFHAEFTGGAPDASALHALIDAEVAKMAEMRHVMLDHVLAIWDTLSAEQRADAIEAMQAAPQERPSRERGFERRDEGRDRGFFER